MRALMWSAARELWVKSSLPIRRNSFRRARHRLVEGMMRRRSKAWTVHGLVRPVVVEPVLTGLKTCNERMVR
jgi:hypothetical protein